MTRTDDYGLWTLETNRDSEPVEMKIRQLLESCTEDIISWRHLASKYRMSLAVVGFLSNWNRDFDLECDVLKLLADRHLVLNIDVYFENEDADL